MPKFVDRLIKEKKDLDVRILKLKIFVSDIKAMDKLKCHEEYLLGDQLQFMDKYSDVLRARISQYI